MRNEGYLNEERGLLEQGARTIGMRSKNYWSEGVKTIGM